MIDEDTEYTYEPVAITTHPDHRQSAQELWFRACDKRISSLELQVHRMLNPEPFSDEWLEAPEYLRGYADGKAATPAWTAAYEAGYDAGYVARKAAVTRTEGDYVHIPAPEWEALKEELETLRSGHPDMDERGVLLSHDAYDLLERQAAIGRSVPVEAIRRGIYALKLYDETYVTAGDRRFQPAIERLASFLDTNGLKEATE